MERLLTQIIDNPGKVRRGQRKDISIKIKSYKEALETLNLEPSMMGLMRGRLKNAIRQRKMLNSV